MSKCVCVHVSVCGYVKCVCGMCLSVCLCVVCSVLGMKSRTIVF